MLKNVSLTKKMMAGFLFISLITVIVAVAGVVGLRSVRANFTHVIETAPLIDAAMEMKVAVARDMQMLMELLAADSSSGLNDAWKEHLEFVATFDRFADAILNGADTEEGRIYKTDDPRLISIVNQADAFHNNEFQPRLKKIYTVMQQKISGQDISMETLDKMDTDADAIGEKMLEKLGEIEDISKGLITAARTQTSSTVDGAIRLLIILGVVSLILSAILGFSITKIITRPVFQANEMARKIADGDMTQQIEIDQSDEIGVLIKSLNTMSRQLQTMFSDIITGTTELNSSSTELSQVSKRIAAGSKQTSERSSSVSAAAEQMGTNMTSVAAATEQTSANIQMIVAAAEEMSTTITEISKNTAKGSETTGQAVKKAEDISSRIGALNQASTEISKVTETIADISEQTNLLALNATIEAARAGEAGKGFAVVAGEIKALAQQTAEATTEINEKISGVQSTTQDAVSAIKAIVDIISDINEIVTAVASAVEEQSATTQEISNNVSQAASGVQEVNENVNQTSLAAGEVSKDIALVSQAAAELNTDSQQVNKNAQSLSDLAENLNQMVRQYKI